MLNVFGTKLYYLSQNIFVFNYPLTNYMFAIAMTDFGTDAENYVVYHCPSYEYFTLICEEYVLIFH
jgi:hypothetical protein